MLWKNKKEIHKLFAIKIELEESLRNCLNKGIVKH